MVPCRFIDVNEEDEVETDLQESEPEEPIDIRIIASEELGTKDYVDIYIINRNHIREQSKSVIPACGFLLTGAFGLIYFIFSGNSNRIPIHPIIIISLLFAAIALAASIIFSIKSVQAASSSQELPETRDQQWDFLLDIYNDEHKWGVRSIWLLGIAIFLLLIIIFYFSIEYLTNTPSPNSASLTQFPKFIIIPLPRLF